MTNDKTGNNMHKYTHLEFESLKDELTCTSLRLDVDDGDVKF